MSKEIPVTGGSGGIGTATYRLAARRGYSVCVNYVRNGEVPAQVVADCREAGVMAIEVQADVAIEEDVVRLFEAVNHELGRITALFNNAGILERQLRVDEMDGGRIGRILVANVTGTLLYYRKAVCWMSMKHGGAGGAIVNVSSVAARVGSRSEYVDYAAAKGVVDAISLGLPKEVTEEGIRVNAVHPGSSTPTSSPAAGSRVA